MSEALIEAESLEGLASPEGLPNMTLADVARTVPLCALSLALGQTTDFLREVLDDPQNADLAPALSAFTKWAETQFAGGTRDDFISYLADQRAELLNAVWSAYDPDGLVEDEARDAIGDEVLGNTLWWSFLGSAGLVSEADSRRWANLWNFLIVNDLLSDDADEPVVESTEKETDEW